MKWAWIFGGVGGAGTTFSFVPQVWKVFQASSSADKTTSSSISPYMLIVHSVGVTSWIMYGALKQDLYVIAFNSLSLLMVQSILWKTMWDRRGVEK